MYYTGVYSWDPKRHGPPAVALAALPHETGLPPPPVCLCLVHSPPCPWRWRMWSAQLTHVHSNTKQLCQITVEVLELAIGGALCRCTHTRLFGQGLQIIWTTIFHVIVGVLFRRIDNGSLRGVWL
jgi:hypothetical protein